MTITSPSSSQIRALEKMLGSGEVTIVLVYSPSCPHCHTYMPIWKELTKTKGRNSNMVAIQANAYDDTSLSVKAPINAVPTVLYVNQQGKITEVKEPRNMPNMKNLVVSTPPAPASNFSESAPSANLPEPTFVPMTPAPSPVVPTAIKPEPINMPKVASISPTAMMTLEEQASSLNVLPAMPVSTMPTSTETAPVQMGGSRHRKQKGGDAMAAFLMAAQQAAPAAVLLGAYSAYGRARRSSGLAAPVRSRKARAFLRRLRARRTHRR
jgi:hypothetical protein